MLFAAIIGLIAVTTFRPEWFTFVVGVVGASGALLVVYEVHHTKRIAQAGFVRDLNTAFASDPGIGALWRKLLLDEEVTRDDRPAISSYLTFFETIQLLIDRKVIQIRLVDDLFRNRFFTAVGNPQVQELALLKQAGSFTNVHRLIATWANFLRSEGVEQHAGYYSYLVARARYRGHNIRKLTLTEVDAVLTLQHRVIEALSNSDWLRKNDHPMRVDCVSSHVTLGAFDGDGEL